MTRCFFCAHHPPELARELAVYVRGGVDLRRMDVTGSDRGVRTFAMWVGHTATDVAVGDRIEVRVGAKSTLVWLLTSTGWTPTHAVAS